ncbi:MAG: phosphopentomutase [Coriobacteriia bacterium]|nr:phosphopentomutase [Coriobacteriia bacterium]
MAKFVVLILDGFGMYAMDDAAKVRPEDVGSSTLGSILNNYPDFYLPNLERLGLMNALGKNSNRMKADPSANFGRSNLMHFGADTFMGHQEIMGTLPKPPKADPFTKHAHTVGEYLSNHGYKVEYINRGELTYLLVDDYCTVADNIDADVGMAYNCTAPLDYMPYEKLYEIGQLVRQCTTVNRVIPFGGTGNTIEDVLNAELIKDKDYIGIHAVKSKSYEQGYQCRHLGYGVDPNVQAPTILNKHGISVTLIGKVADIVANDGGKSISCVETDKCMDLTIKESKSMSTGFICTNIQETDLAGHSEDSKWYKELLEIVDGKLPDLIDTLNEDDILLVMADHGNDPGVGHNKHTRELVPLLIHKQDLSGVFIGNRDTLSDVGASVCDYFRVESPENGISFLDLI